MPSTKLLRGLPVSLIESYMGTLCYYKKGYMADWLYNGMLELEIDEVIIDVLKETIFPDEISIIPIDWNDEMNIIYFMFIRRRMNESYQYRIGRGFNYRV